MKAIEISFNTQLYKVTTNNIQICCAEKIDKETVKRNESGIDILKIYHCYDWYMAYSNDSVFTCKNGNKLFLDLKEAQKEQCGLRRELFNSVRNKMLDAQNEYSKIVDEYYNLPLSNPYENENR